MTTPVKYAETTLGVHTEYSKGEALIEQLEQERKVLIELENTVRTLRQQAEDRAYDIGCELRADQEFPSQAAFERKLKEETDGDPDLREMRSSIVGLANQANLQGGVVRNLEVKLKLVTARVDQLGGLLNFYAASKAAQTQARKEQNDPSARWPY